MRGAALGTHISSGTAVCTGHAHFVGPVRGAALGSQDHGFFVVGWRNHHFAEACQKALFLRFKGYMVKTQKRSNTEPHGVPGALDRFVGKVVEFSTTWKRRESLEPTKKTCFLPLMATG